MVLIVHLQYDKVPCYFVLSTYNTSTINLSFYKKPYGIVKCYNMDF